MTQWGNKNVQKFYNSTRNTLKDVYKSELKLLKLIQKNEVKSIYDFGCASGGFMKYLKNSSVRFIILEMIMKKNQ